jgi:hypothetical protein
MAKGHCINISFQVIQQEAYNTKCNKLNAMTFASSLALEFYSIRIPPPTGLLLELGSKLSSTGFK